MLLLGLGATMFVLFGYLSPLFPSARDHNPDLFLKVFSRNRCSVPTANFAVCPGGNDRMKRDHTELARCVSKIPQDIHLVATTWPPETGTVDQETFISETDGERGCLSGVAPVIPPVWAVIFGKLRIQDILVGFEVCPTSSSPVLYKVFDHLLMLH